MPPAATKSKYGKISSALNFDPTPPPGACNVSKVWATLRWTNSPRLVPALPLKLEILHFVSWTELRTNRRMDDQITRCLRRTFQAVGIRIISDHHREEHICDASKTNMLAFNMLQNVWQPYLEQLKEVPRLSSVHLFVEPSARNIRRIDEYFKTYRQISSYSSSCTQITKHGNALLQQNHWNLCNP